MILVLTYKGWSPSTNQAQSSKCQLEHKSDPTNCPELTHKALCVSGPSSRHPRAQMALPLTQSREISCSPLETSRKGKGPMHTNLGCQPFISAPPDSYTFQQAAFPRISTEKRVVSHPYEESLRTCKACILHDHDTISANSYGLVAVPTQVGGNWNRGRG
ncbi:unnamed protein product [Prunus armeniaca]|uniref:Uncharacterized protein n=1 Tax=Prunus armeniaca TaxID=36596 RepID=A0A6J5XRB5_PRUAR|nr:hypothetical protein GBA52_020667 [Prunus armeniaca]CAB4313668.1 unnamed protein product [Prunus armeniaca]